MPMGGTPVDLLDGNFIYTSDTVANNVESASDTKGQVLLISRTLPIVLAVIGALLLIFGLLLVMTSRRESARHRAEEIADAESGVKA